MKWRSGAAAASEPNDRAYDKEDYLGKNHEKQLRSMSD
jgi:hypothetical protein